MEIARGIHRVVAPLGERINALYLFVGPDATLLVDTGLAVDPAETLAPYLRSIGRGPDALTWAVNTHADFDHMGGNASLKRMAPGVRLMCGALDRSLVEDVDRMIAERYGEFAADHGIDDTDETKAWIRENAAATPVDAVLEGGESLDLGGGWTVEILHTPGHSHGSVSVWDARSGSLVIGDAVLGAFVPLADGSPAFPPTYRYVEEYVATIGRLQGLPVDLLLTSHYPVYRGPAAADFLAGTLAYVERVDEAVRRELASSPSTTLASLVTRLGPALGEWPAAASQLLCYPLLGHLERLERQRVVERVRGPEREVAWRLAG
jgi:glyoxylase-like metal-dependent hydrolase (beta-lactamase superfamily II)